MGNSEFGGHRRGILSGVSLQAIAIGLYIGTGVGILAGALATVPVAHAQAIAATSGGAIEEIIVTARKREETLQQAPLSIKAFTAAALEQRGVDSIEDLAKFTPGLNFNATTSRFASSIFVRGMSQTSGFGDNRRDLVTVFIDGVPYIGNPSGIGLQDLSRVEVIKGPQSALFGRATFGGAISLITETPGDEFKAKASVTAATYGDYRGSFAIQGPLIGEILSAGIAGDFSTFDGFYKNALGGRLGASDQAFGSGTLVFKPHEDFRIKARYSRRHDEDGPAASVLIARWPEHNCGPFPGFQPRPLAGLPAGFTLERARRAFCGELKAPSGPVSINTQLPAASVGRTKLREHGVELDHALATVNVDWDIFAGHTLSAIASDQRQDVTLLQDFERAPEDRYQLEGENRQKQSTGELRLTSPDDQRFRWMIGGSLLDQDYASGGYFINGTLFGPTAGGPATRNRNVSKIENKSAFGSVAFDITQKLDVSLEARRQKDTITNAVGTPGVFEISTKATLPRAIVRYEFSDTTNTYFNYAEGNQPTQGNADVFLLSSAARTVAANNGVLAVVPEAAVKSYEIGLKHRSDDGRWYANIALYSLKWTGRQGVRTVQVDIDGNGVINLTGTGAAREVFNAVAFAAGDSKTNGIEIDAAWNVTDRLGVGGSISYADTKITKALNEAVPFRLFGLVDSKGKKYPGVPKWSGAAFAEYEAPLGGEWNWFARADATFLGKRYDNIVNLAYVPNQWRVNLRGGIRTGRWEIVAWVNNVLNDKTLEASNYNSDSAADPFFFQLVSSEATLPRKRQFGVTASVRY
jgi:iron complex outermembrane receptor protein